MQQDESTTPIKAYNKSELSDLYGRTIKTFNAWIKPHENKIGKMIGRSYTPAQVKKIFEALGAP
jgi:hypothetical protein